MIPYGKQDICQADIDAVVNVLKSDFLTQGEVVPAFEQGVARYCAADFAVAVNSATSALHLACLALDVGPGDWVWTTPITFVASANCALYCGAGVDFVDIDPKSYNLSIEALMLKLEEAEFKGRLPKVLIAVHLCGEPCDMRSIHSLSKRYGFRVIEDASHAIGGRYYDQAIGSCQYSDISIFSFHPVKIITSAEGGMAVTNDEMLARKMTLLRSHGITRDASEMTHKSDGSWYYQQIALGFNYRMTELQAALGLSQLGRLDEFVLRRHQLADRYQEMLQDLPLQLPWSSESAYSGMHLYVVRLQTEKIGKSHKAVFDGLRGVGIGVNLHYIPVHTQPYYQSLGFSDGDFPEAERYYSEALSLPLFYGLAGEEQDFVIDTLTRLLEVAAL